MSVTFGQEKVAIGELTLDGICSKRRSKMRERIEGWLTRWLARPVAWVIFWICFNMILCRALIVSCADKARGWWTGWRTRRQVEEPQSSDAIATDSAQCMPTAAISTEDVQCVPTPAIIATPAPVSTKRKSRRELAARV
jgi:hypothetical protein